MIKLSLPVSDLMVVGYSIFHLLNSCDIRSQQFPEFPAGITLMECK